MQINPSIVKKLKTIRNISETNKEGTGKMDKHDQQLSKQFIQINQNILDQGKLLNQNIIEQGKQFTQINQNILDQNKRFDEKFDKINQNICNLNEKFNEKSTETNQNIHELSKDLDKTKEEIKAYQKKRSGIILKGIYVLAALMTIFQFISIIF